MNFRILAYNGKVKDFRRYLGEMRQALRRTAVSGGAEGWPNDKSSKNLEVT